METSTSPSVNDVSTTSAPNNNKFNADEVTAMLKQVIEQTIGDAAYAHGKTNQWNTAIVDGCMKKFRETYTDYKCIVNCIIIQRTGAGFHAGSAVYFDTLRDGSATYQYENKSLYAIASLFALST